VGTQKAFQCENCGHTWSSDDAADTPGSDVFCPVCHYPVRGAGGSQESAQLASESGLAHELGALITQARNEGLELDAIIDVLRAELEFTAELAQSGRRFFVQIIDLGPEEQPARGVSHPATRGSAEMLAGRRPAAPPQTPSRAR
jgi:hypothetical protein